MDEIYNYITDEFKDVGIARQMADPLESAILGLDETPYRGAVRRAGASAERFADVKRGVQSSVKLQQSKAAGCVKNR